MKPILAGGAAAATVVLAALAGWALFGPRSPPRAVTPAGAAPAAARIAQHAQAVAGERDGMRYVGMEESLARPREGYRVTFAAGSEVAAAKDDAASAARQADWQRRFCTAALQEEMAAQGVNVVTGRVVGADGRTAYAVDCVRGQPAQQAGPGGPML